MGPPPAGVLTGQEVALHPTLRHAIEVGQLRVVAVHARHPGEPEVVVRRCCVAVPRLEQADNEFAEVRPVAGGHPSILDITTQILVRGVVCSGLRQVAGQCVVQSRDVGRALDGRVAAQGHNAAARPAHVAEQQLQDAGSAYDLHAGGVLRPAQRVGNASGPLASGVGAEQFRDAQKLFRLAAAHLGNDLRRVAGEVPAQNLHNAARMLQGRVARCVCHVFVRRGIWFAAAILAVAMRAVRSFEDSAYASNRPAPRGRS